MVDPCIGRCISIAAIALAACHSDDAATSGDPSTAADTGTTDTGAYDEGPAICQSYGEHVQMCGESFHVQTYAAQAFGRCAADLSVAAGVGPECSDADEDYFACLSAIECAALEDPSLVCDDARTAKELACGGGATSSGDGSSSGG